MWFSPAQRLHTAGKLSFIISISLMRKISLRERNAVIKLTSSRELVKSKSGRHTRAGDYQLRPQWWQPPTPEGHSLQQVHSCVSQEPDPPFTRKANQGLVSHQHPALRNQVTCLYMKLCWQMQGGCSSKWSQRMLTSIVPVANKPCTEFMSQTLFSLKQ